MVQMIPKIKDPLEHNVMAHVMYPWFEWLASDEEQVKLTIKDLGEYAAIKKCGYGRS